MTPFPQRLQVQVTTGKVTVQEELENRQTGPVIRCAKVGRARSVSVSPALTPALATYDAEECSRKPLLISVHPISLVQSTLRHASVQTTGRYFHRRPDTRSHQSLAV